MKYYSVNASKELERWRAMRAGSSDHASDPIARTAAELMHSRAAAVQSIAPQPTLATERDRAPGGGSTEGILEELFLHLAGRALARQPLPAPSDALILLQRRFEASGILRESYDTTEPQPVCCTLRTYLLLGWVTLLTAREPGSELYYYLNTALKVRDLVIKLDRFIATADDALIAESFVLTCNHTLDALYDSRGFRLPAE